MNREIGTVLAPERDAVDARGHVNNLGVDATGYMSEERLMPFEYRYPRPALTVDCAVFAPVDGHLEVLLVERGEPPYEGEWATPGGFVEIEEPIAEAAARELAEETGLESVELESFDVFGTPGRDPRGRIVAVGHWALVDPEACEIEAHDDAAACGWHPVEALPHLAFDHRAIVEGGLAAMRARARSGALGRNVLEEPFSLEDLRALYETILSVDVETERLREGLVGRAGALRRVEGAGDVDLDDAAWTFVPEAFDRLRREPVSPWID